jgi:hypothetical protein
MQLCQFALLFSFFTILAACSVTDEASSAEELKDYISDPEHRLCQQAEMNGYQVTVVYKPGDLLVHEEIGEEPTDPTVLEQLKKKYSNYHYFSLSISGKPEVHAADALVERFNDRIETLSLHIDGYVTLTTSAQDTIPLYDFLVNRTYGHKQSHDLIFVFDKQKSAGQDWIQFNLNEFGLGTGSHQFKFNLKDFEQVPKLKFNITSGA